MGETKNPHFYVFGTFGHGPGSQNQLFSSLEIPRHSKAKRTTNSLYNISNGTTLKFESFLKVGNGGRRKIPTIRLRNSWTSWIWDQCLWKTWNGHLVNLRNFESRNFETKKLWNQETKKPPQHNYRTPPLHRHPLGGHEWAWGTRVAGTK